MNRERPKRKHRISNRCCCKTDYRTGNSRHTVGLDGPQTRRAMYCERKIPNSKTEGLHSPNRPGVLRAAVDWNSAMATQDSWAVSIPQPKADAGATVCRNQETTESVRSSCFQSAKWSSLKAALKLRPTVDAPLLIAHCRVEAEMLPQSSRNSQRHPVCSPGSRNPHADTLSGGYKRTDHYEKRNVDQCGSVRRDPHRDR